MFLIVMAQDVERAKRDGGEINIFCGPKRDHTRRPKSVDFCEPFSMDLFIFPQVKKDLLSWARKIAPHVQWETRYSLENEYCEFYLILKRGKS